MLFHPEKPCSCATKKHDTKFRETVCLDSGGNVRDMNIE